MNKIIKIIENMKGSLLGIGLIDENVLNAIEKNENINECYILSNLSLTGKKFSITKKGRSKKVNIKKLKKHFKRKSVDNIICNYEIIKQFQRSFVPSTIYINSHLLYIYGQKEEIMELKKRYQRYTEDIEIIKSKTDIILKVNNKNTKNKLIKDKIYRIIDFFTDTANIITDILLN